MDHKTLVAQRLAAIIPSLEADQIFALLEKPKSSEMGDIAFPAFSLAKVERKAPQAIANEIAEKSILLALKRSSLPVPISTSSWTRRRFLPTSSRPFLLKKRTMANRTSVMDKMSPWTCPVPTSQNPSPLGICAPLLSPMLSATSTPNWATRPSGSITWETGASSLAC